VDEPLLEGVCLVKKLLPALAAIAIVIVIVKMVTGGKSNEPAGFAAGPDRADPEALADAVDEAIADAVEEITGEDA
jgi:hypothetical protein